MKYLLLLTSLFLFGCHKHQSPTPPPPEIFPGECFEVRNYDSWYPPYTVDSTVRIEHVDLIFVDFVVWDELFGLWDVNNEKRSLRDEFQAVAAVKILCPLL